MGSGSLKLRGSNRRVDDGAWHKLDITRNRKKGNLLVDSERVDFETPGDAETLELISPLYLGGLDANVESIFLPPVLWSAGFKRGFVGCLRDLVINGQSLDVADFAKSQDSGSIRPSCHIMPPKCKNKPCMHGGKCIEGWNRFICDCTQTSFTGPTCGKGNDFKLLSFEIGFEFLTLFIVPSEQILMLISFLKSTLIVTNFFVRLSIVLQIHKTSKSKII